MDIFNKNNMNPLEKGILGYMYGSAFSNFRSYNNVRLYTVNEIDVIWDKYFEKIE